MLSAMPSRDLNPHTPLRLDHAAGDLHLFQRRVADLLLSLSTSDLLSASWLLRLLDTFLVVHCEFHSLLSPSPSAPLRRTLADYSDRSLKTLDICNAARDALDHLRHALAHADIAATAILDSRSLADSHLRRARRGLADLTSSLLDAPDPNPSPALRNRSFARPPPRHLRSLTWTAPRPWSLQLQAIGGGLAPPKPHEGIAVAAYTMNCVALFAMWALVAAVPCGDRGAIAQFAVPRSFPWAGPMTALQDAIVDEARKRGRKGSGGLLRELRGIERCALELTEGIEGVRCPLPEEREGEVRVKAEEMHVLVGELRNELEPLERQVREVFRRIVKSRMDMLDGLGQSS